MSESAQSKLLSWLKMRLAGYAGIKVDNFHMSWKDGLGTLLSSCPRPHRLLLPFSFHLRGNL